MENAYFSERAGYEYIVSPRKMTEIIVAIILRYHGPLDEYRRALIKVSEDNADLPSSYFNEIKRLNVICEHMQSLLDNWLQSDTGVSYLRIILEDMAKKGEIEYV